MELLFKRNQARTVAQKVNFKLWAKIEPDEEERALISKYSFADAMLIDAFQPKLLRNTLLLGVAITLIGTAFLGSVISFNAAFALSAIGAGIACYYYFHDKRETIYVKDLLHGRDFTCDSVVDLARKEAWLETIVGFLRQVIESAKHWDGTDRHTIEPLPKDEAKQVILRGL